MKNLFLTLLVCIVCVPFSAKAQQAKAVRPILDLTPEIVIHDKITIDEASTKSVSQGITFVVDENLPAPEKTRLDLNTGGTELAEMVAEHAKLMKPGEGFVASSFQNDSMLYYNDDVLFCCMLQCFAEHRPLVLSPDMVWIVIAQNFSYFVNENAETLRSKLVSHDGKMTLMVNSDEDLFNGHPDWEAIFKDFERQITQNSKPGVAETLTADFTTTGPAERIASQITLMDAMKQYFEYVVHRMACGIPTVTLLGTADDWQKVYDKAMKLKKFGMGWYTKDLDPILKEFVRAAKGKVNQAFWQDMVMKNTPLRLRGGACSMETATELDGWFLKLFPYDKDGVRTKSTLPKTHHMLSEMVRVPFRYVVSIPTGEVASDTPMELFAGLVSVKEDPTTLALTPQIGWMVRKAEDPNAQNNKLMDMLNNQEKTKTDDSSAVNDKTPHAFKGLDIVLDDSRFGGLELRVKEVPEALRQCKVIDRLTLFFVDGVRLPEWMDSIQINHFTAHGRVTEKEAAAIKARFPHINLDAPVTKKNKRHGTSEPKAKKPVHTPEAKGKNTPQETMADPLPELKLDSVVTLWDEGQRTTQVAEYDSLYRLKAYYAQNQDLRHCIEYDAQNRPLLRRSIKADGTPYKLTFCEYDERGNKVFESDSLLAPDVRNYENFRTYAFAYDKAKRLTTKDLHVWKKNTEASHYRYEYHYNKKGVLSEVLKYEYEMDAPWARMKDVPQQIRTELQERATYNKQGKITLYEDLLKNQKTVYHYGKDGVLTHSERLDDDEVVNLTRYKYDHSGNLIAQDLFDAIDGEWWQNSQHMIYNTSYDIEKVAGLRDGFYKLFVPSNLQGDEFYRPTLVSPLMDWRVVDETEGRTTTQFYYSAP